MSYAETSNESYRNFILQIRIMINHCVILGAINDIKMSWGVVIGRYISFEQLITEFTWKVSHCDCIFQY